jgi:hypothetical protein
MVLKSTSDTGEEMEGRDGERAGETSDIPNHFLFLSVTFSIPYGSSVCRRVSEFPPSHFSLPAQSLEGGQQEEDKMSLSLMFVKTAM